MYLFWAGLVILVLVLLESPDKWEKYFNENALFIILIGPLMFMMFIGLVLF